MRFRNEAQSVQRSWGTEEQSKYNVSEMLRIRGSVVGEKVEETKGKDQVKQDHMKELQFKWDGKAIILFLCTRLERTKAEASKKDIAVI